MIPRGTPPDTRLPSTRAVAPSFLPDSCDKLRDRELPAETAGLADEPVAPLQPQRLHDARNPGHPPRPDVQRSAHPERHRPPPGGEMTGEPTPPPGASQPPPPPA